MNITESTIDTINDKSLSIRRANHGINACSRLAMEIALYINGEQVAENDDFKEFINIPTLEGLLDAVGELTHEIASHAEWIEGQTRKPVA